jgi:hypothetical protein
MPWRLKLSLSTRESRSWKEVYSSVDDPLFVRKERSDGTIDGYNFFRSSLSEDEASTVRRTVQVTYRRVLMVRNVGKKVSPRAALYVLLL